MLVVPFLPTEIAAPGAVSHGNNTGTTSGISWSYLWALGSGLALLRLGWQMIGLHRLLRNARDLGEFNFEDCRLRIKESPDVHSPCVTGWSQATLLVPPGSSEWNTPRWECILRHERQHAVQQDVKARWFISPRDSSTLKARPRAMLRSCVRAPPPGSMSKPCFPSAPSRIGSPPRSPASQRCANASHGF